MIPASANLSIEPSPFEHNQVVLQDKPKTIRKIQPVEDKLQVSIYKLEKTNNQTQLSIAQQKTASVVPQNSRQPSAKLTVISEVNAPPGTREVAIREHKQNLTHSCYQPEIELSFQMEPVTMKREDFRTAVTPETKNSTLLIQEVDAAYVIFEKLAKVQYLYKIPSLIIESARLMNLAKMNLMTTKLLKTKEIINSCVKNSIEVLTLIAVPGRRFKHPDVDYARNLAATIIQNKFRAFSVNKKYKAFRKRRWAAGVIAMSWILHIKAKRVKKNLAASRQKCIENHDQRVRNLNWEHISDGACVIHIPLQGLNLSLFLFYKNVTVSVKGFWS